MLLKNKPCVLTTQGEDRRRKKNCGCNFDFEFFFFFFGKSDNDRQRARELLGLHFRTSELNLPEFRIIINNKNPLHIDAKKYYTILN